MPKNAIGGSCDSFMFGSLRNCQTASWSSYTILHFYQKFMKTSSFSRSSPEVGVVITIIYFSCSDMCVLVSHCGFNVHFLDDLYNWTFLHMLELLVLLLKCLYKSFDHFSIVLPIFFLFTYKKSFCIWRYGPFLGYMC